MNLRSFARAAALVLAATAFPAGAAERELTHLGRRLEKAMLGTHHGRIIAPSRDRAHPG